MRRISTPVWGSVPTEGSNPSPSASSIVVTGVLVVKGRGGASTGKSRDARFDSGLGLAPYLDLPDPCTVFSQVYKHLPLSR